MNVHAKRLGFGSIVLAPFGAWIALTLVFPRVGFGLLIGLLVLAIAYCAGMELVDS